MAEVTVDAGARGELLIRPKALQRIAATAATQVAGVQPRQATLGRGLPKVAAQQAGRHARASVEVAVGWGIGLAETAAAVRTEVGDQLGRQTGLQIDTVDVRVVQIDPEVRSEDTGPDAPESTAVAARRPAGPAVGVVVLGLLGAITTAAVGAAGIREGLQAAGLVNGESWSGPLLERLAEVSPADWMTPAGVASVVVGLIVLALSLAPRRRREVRVGTVGAVWLRRRDASRLAADTAAGVDSVVSASARARRRVLRVDTRVTGDPERARGEVATAVGERLREVSPTPRIRSRVREAH